MMNELATKHSLVSIIFMIIAVVLSVGCSAESSTLEAVIAEDSIVTPVLGETSIRPVDNVAMVYVPDGRLQMGSNQRQINIAGELCDAHPDSYGKCASETFELEIPQHPVDIDAFWIDQTEVAVSQYHLCVEAGDCSPSRLAGDPDYYSDTYPVAGIPWGDAVNYCEWVGGRLPYEAEWEYAARGSSGLIFPWGNDFDCQKGSFWEDCTPCDDGFSGPAPVGSFPSGASWVGALDMAGNVWEWVADELDESSLDYGENGYNSSKAETRVLRGGSWGYCPAFVRSSYRYAVGVEADYLAVGFRCVVPISE